jgi:hypothetical protein
MCTASALKRTSQFRMDGVTIYMTAGHRLLLTNLGAFDGRQTPARHRQPERGHIVDGYTRYQPRDTN